MASWVAELIEPFGHGNRMIGLPSVATSGLEGEGYRVILASDVAFAGYCAASRVALATTVSELIAMAITATTGGIAPKAARLKPRAL